jgi:mitochondrial ATPase complex subunit ATP10
MQFSNGKSFIAPPRLFKADRSLYFPNLYGETLLKDAIARDTTPVLEGKASVVTVFSSRWAESQVETFTGGKENPALHEVIRNSKGIAQMIQINVEEDSMKAYLVGLFSGSLRKRLSEADWGKYFIVRKGITDEIRESIGLLNSKVGYTYLVDKECRIRWAGSGQSEPEERESIVKGLQRMVDEATKEAKF